MNISDGELRLSDSSDVIADDAQASAAIADSCATVALSLAIAQWRMVALECSDGTYVRAKADDCVVEVGEACGRLGGVGQSRTESGGVGRRL